MSNRNVVIGLAVLGLVLATGGAMAQQHQHPQQAEPEPAAEMPAMCHEMSAQMNEHMEMMRTMMARMDMEHMGGAAMTHGAEPGHDGSAHSRAAMQEAPGMHAMASSMQQMAAMDVAAIESAEEADRLAEDVSGRLDTMRSHMEQMQSLVERLRERAAKLRDGSR